jgi:tetratricopeptide (TPR) repeat protein
MLAILGLGLLWGGHPDEAQRIAEEADRLATKVGYDGAAGNARALASATATAMGDWDDMARQARRVLEAYGRAGPWSFAGFMGLSMARFYAGDWDKAEQYSLEAFRPDSSETVANFERGWRVFLQAHRGDRTWLDDYCRRRSTLFSDGRTPFMGDTLYALLSVPALALAQERDEAHRLYPVVLGAIRDGVVVDTEMTAGIASACGTDWDRAETHFETALRQATDLPHRLAQPETRRWYAWMLLDRDAPGDRDKARTLLGEAIEMYRKIGMPKHVEIAEKMVPRQ